MQRRHHYEHAFEEYLRSRRIPYVAVDEARRALIPDARLTVDTGRGHANLKSFDFVIYGESTNLVAEVKGRRVGNTGPPGRRRTGSRLENWVTLDDIEALSRWERLFGAQFEAVFVFVYWCEQMPPDALFQEIFERAGRWYALRAVRLADYAARMRLRSGRWRTVHLPPEAFAEVSCPFSSPESLTPGLSGPLQRRLLDPPPDLPSIDRLLSLT